MVNFLVAGDIGAAANLIRNIMLLSEDIHWSFNQSRLDTILNQYPEFLSLNKTKWIFIEAKLKFFKSQYGVDLSQELNWADYKQNVAVTDKPAIFINHSFVWELDNFLTFALHMPSIIVMPTTARGLEWQIRAYCEKKGVESMHNFTFPDNVEEQKIAYIEEHGVEAWHKENIANMKMIIQDRRNYIIDTIDPDIIIPLEWIISGDDDRQLVNKLSKHFNIDIDFDQAATVLNTYRSRHWPLEQTFDWKYA